MPNPALAANSPAISTNMPAFALSQNSNAGASLHARSVSLPPASANIAASYSWSADFTISRG